MIEVCWKRGIELPGLGLCLDPRERSKFAFVSHAHSDHTGLHEETILSEGTSRLMHARIGAGSGRHHILPFGETGDFGSFRVRLLPAGHVLGSAQLFLETEHGSLLYTGDFKLRHGLSCEPAGFARAETLIMETTYGLPKYVFPPTDQVLHSLRKFCIEAIEDGEVPVLLGYSLGKAQEILGALVDAGLVVALHPSVFQMTKIYEQLGRVFPAHSLFAPGEEAGKVLIFPPTAANTRVFRKIPKKRVAMLSGWALDPGILHRHGCDAAFPLSDHADYPDLMRHVEQVAPKRVLTVHGFAREFARDLRARGIEAWALGSSDQLELFSGEAAEQITFFSSPPAREGSSAGSKLPAVEGTPFAGFCEVCESIAETTGRTRKIRLVSEFLAGLGPEDLRSSVAWLTGRALPGPGAPPLGIGWAAVKRALISATGVTEAQLRRISRKNNDSGISAREVLSAAPTTRRADFSAIRDSFDRIAASRGASAKIEILTNLLRGLPAAEGAMIVKLISGDLRIGLKEGLVEEAVASAFAGPFEKIREAAMLTGDIAETAVLARNGRLDSVSMRLFQPLACMLAGSEPDAAGIWKRCAAMPGFSGSVWVEEKMDGIRAQLHCDGDRAEIYSRDLKLLTPIFPEIARAAERTNCNFVLDGEILAFENGRALDFVELQKRLGRKQQDLFLESGIPVSFFAFDCLFAQGRELWRLPLCERAQALRSLSLIAPLNAIVPGTADSLDALEERFLQARKSGHEGLMIKDPSSAYTPGKRGLSWIKWKKALASLDVVVVAAEFGHGKRAGVLSDYTFAVRGMGGELLVIGKAYTGLTDREIEELTERFFSLQEERRGNKIVVRPEVVLEVTFDSLRESKRHPSGLAMRFPRIRRIRTDKSPAEIDTLETARSFLRSTEK